MHPALHRGVLRTGVCMHTCITSAEGVCCSNVCAQTCIPLCKKCVVYMCVCTHVPLSAEGVCRTHVCAHTCIPLCKRCMSCICVCAHASHFTGGVCHVHMCTCTHMHPVHSAFHAHMCTHTCVTSAEGVFCARVHIRTPLCRTPVLTRGVQVSAHTCAPGSPHLLYTRGAGWGSHSPPSFAGQVLSPCSSPLPCCPPEPDIYILIFSKGGNALRCKCLHCGCT